MLQSFPVSYGYQQYFDDQNIQAFIAAQNAYATAYLLAMNSLNLPVYVNLPSNPTALTIQQNGTYGSVINNTIPYNQSGPTSVGGNLIVGLLQWVLRGIYGIERPTLGQLISTTSFNGLYNKSLYNKTYYNQSVLKKTYSYSTANDDIYKRVATWNLYKGDGFQFTARWLKRRVIRFLTGTGGVDPGIDQTYSVSVQYLANYQVVITCNSLAPGAAFIPQLAELVASGALQLPFQYVYTVTST